MSEVTTLKCWPSCVCALDWSYDGILALASDEKVELLFPSIESQDSERDIPHWQHFPILAPYFTTVELPPRESTPTRIFSVGEEISKSYGIALAWSPPGLAKHRRCALAILTANLVLSIWASDGKPQNQVNWKRKLIINDTLDKYFNTDQKEAGENVSAGGEEKWLLRRRTRAFAWAPGLPTKGPAGVVGTSLSWPPYMMVVANDDNQVVFLAVESPTSKLWAENTWNSELLCYFSLAQNRQEVNSQYSTLEDMLDEQSHVSHLSWSPWTTKGGELQSILAYATNKDVRLRLIMYSQEKSLSFGPEVVCAGVSLRFAGPITWSPNVRDGTLTLALFASNKVICLTISASDASILKRATHNLDGRWDIISGFAWDNQDEDRTRLHFSSQITTTRSPTAVLELSSAGLKDITTPNWPYWREQVSGSQGHFSAEYDLKGNANARVWGLSTSPLGEFIACCYSLHPTDMIEYGPQNDRRTTIAFTNARTRGGELEFPVKCVSAESIFFTARKWIEKNVESEDDLASVKKDIQDRLIHAYIPSPDESTLPAPAYDVNDISTLLSAFKRNVFLERNTLRDRIEILTSYICTPTMSTDLPRMLIAFRLAKEIQNIASELSPDDQLSRNILDSSHQVITMILSAEEEEEEAEEEEAENDADGEGEADADAPAEADPDPEVDAEKQVDTEELPTAAPSPPPAPAIADDICTFCDAPIPFTNLTTALCTNGHEFARCGLTFLAIQLPGITKCCGICNTPYLNEEAIFHQSIAEPAASTSPISDAEQHEDIEMRDVENENGSVTPRHQIRMGDGRKRKAVPLTLARVLILACDACIYCGGKFVG